MSKLTETLRTVGVFNPAIFNGRQPYIWVHAYTGRGSYGHAWVVTKRGEDISDPKANWHEKPNRWFGYPGGRKTGPDSLLALDEAKAWASERFGVEKWAKDPYGCSAPAAFVAGRTAYLLYAVGLYELIAWYPDGLNAEALSLATADTRFAREARPAWFEAAVELLVKNRCVERSPDGLLIARN
jgi:hypothetical protein